MSGHGRLRKLTVVLIVTLVLSFVCPPFCPVHAERLLVLERAIKLGKDNSDALYQLELKLQKKNTELAQARKGIKDIRKKESTVRFSLLFNIKLPEKHGMPKEVDLVTKIPTITAEINEIKKNIEYTKRKVEHDVKQAYLNVVSEIYNSELRKAVLEEETAALNMLKKRFMTGQAKMEQVAKKEEELETAKQALQKSIMNLENFKKKLSDLIGIDVTYGYSFDRSFITASVEREHLPGILEKSRERSYEVYYAASQKALSESKVETIRQIYRSAFGSKVSAIEAELNKPGRVDFKRLKPIYDQALQNIQAPWDGFFTIPLLFFVIKIPKEWFMGEFTALRYFEDESDILIAALQQRESDIKAYEAAVKDHDSAVNDGYLTLKEMEMAFYTSVAQYEKSLEVYDKSLKMNRLGLMTFEELEAVKKEVRNNAFTAVGNLINYNKQIHSFNLLTSGAIDKFLGGAKVTIESLDTGISFLPGEEQPPEEEEAKKPVKVAMWFIDSSNTDYKVYFRVQVPEEIGATHFALYTSERRQIGTKTKITERIPHIPIMFTDTSLLTVELYKGNELIGTALVDGFDIQGELKITPAGQKPGEEAGNGLTGAWQVSASEIQIISVFSITVDPALGFTHYELYAEDGQLIGEKTPIDQTVSHLSSVFGDTSGMLLKLYTGEDLKAYAVLAEDNSLEITLVEE